MAYGKGCNEQQQFFPIGKMVADAQCGNEQDMVESVQVGNVLPAQRKVKAKIVHVGSVVNVSQLGLCVTPCL